MMLFHYKDAFVLQFLVKTFSNHVQCSLKICVHDGVFQCQTCSLLNIVINLQRLSLNQLQWIINFKIENRFDQIDECLLFYYLEYFQNFLMGTLQGLIRFGARLYDTTAESYLFVRANVRGLSKVCWFVLTLLRG